METKGHFWKARFGNRRLDTEEETVGCSLYVDLNQDTGLRRSLDR